MKKYFLLSFIAISIFACGPSTKIVKSWRDPQVTIDTTMIHKFVVAALLKNETVRRSVEDQMAARYPGKAVQSYSIFGNTELTQNDDFYAKKLNGEGYDGVVVMRLVKVDKDRRYVPGSYPAYYGTWRGYYGYAWPNYYDPGYYTTDKTFYVEVNVYSLLRNKLIWTGITSTINPTSGDQLFSGVTKAVNQKMIQEGFLK
ncbi:MAG: hypothetical protein JST75_17715 [Bacteroidetes bacterium]|nr:hypothetical protein [Bacteroidota bacterium]